MITHQKRELGSLACDYWWRQSREDWLCGQLPSFFAVHPQGIGQTWSGKQINTNTILYTALTAVWANHVCNWQTQHWCIVHWWDKLVMITIFITFVKTNSLIFIAYWVKFKPWKSFICICQQLLKVKPYVQSSSNTNTNLYMNYCNQELIIMGGRVSNAV